MRQPFIREGFERPMSSRGPTRHALHLELLIAMFAGAPRETRTPDLLITNRPGKLHGSHRILHETHISAASYADSPLPSCTERT